MYYYQIAAIPLKSACRFASFEAFACGGRRNAAESGRNGTPPGAFSEFAAFFPGNAAGSMLSYPCRGGNPGRKDGTVNKTFPRWC